MSEIPVARCDRFMHECFEKTQAAILSLANICANPESNYAIARTLIDDCFHLSFFEHLAHRTSANAAQLSDIVRQYDLVLTNYVLQDSAQYYSALTCENFASRASCVRADVRMDVSHLLDLIMLIENIDQKTESEITSQMADALESLMSEPMRVPYAYARNSAAHITKTRAKKKQQSATPRPTYARVVTDRHAQISQILGHIAKVREETGKSIIALFAEMKYALSQIKDAVAPSSDTPVVIRAQPVGILTCETCGGKMSAQRDTCELVCRGCGRIDYLIDDKAVIEIVPNCSPISRDVIAKSRGGYDYVRHLQIWLDRLQANESFEFRVQDVEKVRRSILNCQSALFAMNWRTVTCADVLRHLSLCHLSSLGEHAPKLVKELGGCPPPILNHEARQIILRDFQNIMSVYASVVERGSVNKPYYPFFIAKIIKRRFKGRPELRLLDFIARQGTETVNKHDRIYERICRVAPAHFDLKYEPEID